MSAPQIQTDPKAPTIVTTYSPTLSKLAISLSKAVTEYPDIPRSCEGQARGGKYKYADLADVIKATAPVLAKHELGVLQTISQTPDGLKNVLETLLVHSSGEFVKCTVLFPAGLSAQELGSWITYMRRYSWSTITGASSQADDDGAGAQAQRDQANARQQSQPRNAGPKPAANKPAPAPKQAQGGPIPQGQGVPAWKDAGVMAGNIARLKSVQGKHGWTDKNIQEYRERRYAKKFSDLTPAEVNEFVELVSGYTPHEANYMLQTAGAGAGSPADPAIDAANAAMQQAAAEDAPQLEPQAPEGGAEG